MVLSVSLQVWALVLGAVLFNMLIVLFANAFIAKKAYKRGYDAAQIANEALALGRLLESSRERYYAGEEVARLIETGDVEGLKNHPNTRD